MQLKCFIAAHYCVNKFSDDHDEYWYFKQVLDNADNFEQTNCLEFGGGTDNGGITELTYRSVQGNDITLSIDGGLPVPELATFNMRADTPTDEFVGELVSAFSQYHGKNFYHELTIAADFFGIDLYPEMADRSQELSYWDRLYLLVEAAKKHEAMPLADCIRRSLLESGLYTPAVKNLRIGEKHLKGADLYGCYREKGVYYTCFTNERAEMMTVSHEDVGTFMTAICRALPTL